MQATRVRPWYKNVGAQHAAPLHRIRTVRPSQFTVGPTSVRLHFLRERTRHRARYRLERRWRRLEPLRRLDLDLVVAVNPRARRDEMADDDVLLEPQQVVPRAADRRVGQHARGLLERRRRNNDCVVKLALVIPSSNGSLVGGLPPFFTTRSFASEKVCLSTFSPSRNSVSPGSTIFTFCSIWRTITPMCLSLIFTPCNRYTSCTSLSRYSCTARGPLILKISCGFTGPSVRRSPARTRSPSCTRKCLPAGTSYSCGSPSSGWT